MSKREMLRDLLNKEPELGTNQKEQLLANFINKDNNVINDNVPNDNEPVNPNDNVVVTVTETINVGDSINETVDVNVNDIVNAKKKTKPKKLVGIWFEDEIAKALKKLSEKGGKGVQSEIVNKAVKKVLIEQGYLK